MTSEGDLQELLQACSDGDEAAVQALLGDGAAADAADSDGRTCLHHAAESGHTRLCELLLDADADVDAQDRTAGLTPLHLASRHGHVTTVELLLARGAEVDHEDHELVQAVHLACCTDEAPTLSVLLESGAEVNARTASGATPLLFCAQFGAPRCLSLLLGREDLEPGITRGASSYSALHLAASAGHADVLSSLLARGCCPPGDRTGEGRTALHLAAADAGCERCVDVLLPHCDVDDTDDDGRTALLLALTAGHVLVARRLLAAGADPRLGDHEAWTPLHQACSLSPSSPPSHVLTPRPNYDFRSLLDIISDTCGDFNVRDRGGRTPVHAAAEAGNARALVKLLNSGREVDVSLTDARGCLPHHAAAARGHCDALRTLLEHDVSTYINDVTNDGMTCLMLACREMHSECVMLLLDRDADLDVTDHHGNTALHHACDADCEHVIHLLVDAGAATFVFNTDGKLPIELAQSTRCKGIVHGKGGHTQRLIKSPARRENKKKDISSSQNECAKGTDNGLLSSENAQRLRDSHYELVHNLRLESLTSWLYSRQVLTAEENNSLGSHTSHEKVERLLQIVSGKPNAAFHKFVKGLMETEQSHLAGLLLPAPSAGKRKNSDNDEADGPSVTMVTSPKERLVCQRGGSVTKRGRMETMKWHLSLALPESSETLRPCLLTLFRNILLYQSLYQRLGKSDRHLNKLAKSNSWRHLRSLSACGQTVNLQFTGNGNPCDLSEVRKSLEEALAEKSQFAGLTLDLKHTDGVSNGVLNNFSGNSDRCSWCQVSEENSQSVQFRRCQMIIDKFDMEKELTLPKIGANSEVLVEVRVQGDSGNHDACAAQEYISDCLRYCFLKSCLRNVPVTRQPDSVPVTRQPDDLPVTPQPDNVPVTRQPNDTAAFIITRLETVNRAPWGRDLELIINCHTVDDVKEISFRFVKGDIKQSLQRLLLPEEITSAIRVDDASVNLHIDEHEFKTVSPW